MTPVLFPPKCYRYLWQINFHLAQRELAIKRSIVLVSRRFEICGINDVFSRRDTLGKLERIQTKRFHTLCDN